MLVGRERQLAAVDRALTLLELGGDTPAQVLEVTGEPGIGKSRLLNAVRLRAAALGHLVLTGRAPEPELPFGVFANALDDHLATLEPRRLAARGVDLVRCGAVFPALAGAAGEARPPRPYGRYLTHRAVRQLFERLAATKPLVVVLDDLHWADSASVELLDHLLSHPPRGAILLAFGYRPRQAASRWRPLSAGRRPRGRWSRCVSSRSASSSRRGCSARRSTSGAAAAVRGQRRQPVLPRGAAAGRRRTGARTGRRRRRRGGAGHAYRLAHETSLLRVAGRRRTLDRRGGGWMNAARAGSGTRMTVRSPVSHRYGGRGAGDGG